MGKYKLVKTIGKGNFAKVKLAKHMPTGQEVRSHTKLHVYILCNDVYTVHVHVHHVCLEYVYTNVHVHVHHVCLEYVYTNVHVHVHVVLKYKRLH